jgi:hypothetical protein
VVVLVSLRNQPNPLQVLLNPKIVEGNQSDSNGQLITDPPLVVIAHSLVVHSIFHSLVEFFSRKPYAHSVPLFLPTRLNLALLALYALMVSTIPLAAGGLTLWAHDPRRDLARDAGEGTAGLGLLAAAGAGDAILE